MHFAYPLPWWLAVVLAAAFAAVAFAEYRRPLSPLTRLQRGVLVALRVAALAAPRPVPVSSDRDAAAAADARRDRADPGRCLAQHAAGRCRRPDAAGSRERAAETPAGCRPCRRTLRTEIYSVGDRLEAGRSCDGPCCGRPAHRSRRRAGVRPRALSRRSAWPASCVLSDGADTGAGGPAQIGRQSARRRATVPPVFAIGIGSPDGPKDREVLGITAGDPRLDQVVGRFARDGGQPADSAARHSCFACSPTAALIETRRLVPPADGSPIDETFTVSPDPLNADGLYRGDPARRRRVGRARTIAAACW